MKTITIDVVASRWASPVDSRVYVEGIEVVYEDRPPRYEAKEIACHNKMVDVATALGGGFNFWYWRAQQ